MNSSATGIAVTETFRFERFSGRQRSEDEILPSGIRNTMSYEPDGLRIKLEESSGTKKFTWDDQNYLAESDENDDVNVLYNNEPNYYGNLLSQYRKSGAVWTPSFYHYEALGSTRQLTDDTEAVTDQYLYDAWGNVISSSGTTANPFQFTGNVGYYFDVDTENQYIRTRIYSPTIGRWLSVDPLGFVGGMNLFRAYFLPTRIDPSGMMVMDHWGATLPCQSENDGCYCDFGQCNFTISVGTATDRGGLGGGLREVYRICFAHDPPEPETPPGQPPAPQEPAPPGTSDCYAWINRTQEPGDNITATPRGGQPCVFTIDNFPPNEPEPQWDELPPHCRPPLVDFDPPCLIFPTDHFFSLSVRFTISISCGCSFGQNEGTMHIDDYFDFTDLF